MAEQLDFNKTKAILEKYKLPCAKTVLARNVKQAIMAANSIGYPIAMKISSREVIHKTDVGGVKLNITNQQELETSFAEILKNIKKKMPKARIEGIIIQKMHSGTELIIGMQRDVTFNAVLMFGIGGIFVEVLKDISFKIAPVTKEDALEMISEIKGYPILKGLRGKPPVNLDAVAEIIVKLSKLAVENKKISSIDLNPVIANEKEAVIVDARIVE